MALPKLTPDYVEQILVDMELDVISKDNTVVVFWYKGNKIQFFLKKQWFSGRGVIDGYGFDNMIRQIKPTITGLKIYIEQSPVNIEAKAGAPLLMTIQQTVEFCQKYGCEASLSYNGKKKILTASTNCLEAAEKWYLTQ